MYRGLQFAARTKPSIPGSVDHSASQCTDPRSTAYDRGIRNHADRASQPDFRGIQLHYPADHPGLPFRLPSFQ